jgi:hypothetical protein
VTRRDGLLIVGAAALLALAACADDDVVEGVAEEVVERHEVAVDDAERDALAAAPDGFPAEVPLPAADAPTNAVGVSTPQGGRWTLTYQPASADSVAAYRDRLAGAGFDIRVEIDEAEISAFTAVGRGYTVFAGLTGDMLTVAVANE